RIFFTNLKTACHKSVSLWVPTNPFSSAALLSTPNCTTPTRVGGDDALGSGVPPVWCARLLLASAGHHLARGSSPQGAQTLPPPSRIQHYPLSQLMLTLGAL
ncbi:unnamed protein product, partial [Ectocarpus sp. 6 AP-2014]